MMTGGAIVLLFALIGLLVAAIGTACHAWTVAIECLERVERLERGVTIAVKHRERAVDGEADAWWRTHAREG